MCAAVGPYRWRAGSSAASFSSEHDDGERRGLWRIKAEHRKGLDRTSCSTIGVRRRHAPKIFVKKDRCSALLDGLSVYPRRGTESSIESHLRVIKAHSAAGAIVAT